MSRTASPAAAETSDSPAALPAAAAAAGSSSQLRATTSFEVANVKAEDIEAAAALAISGRSLSPAEEEEGRQQKRKGSASGVGDGMIEETMRMIWNMSWRDIHMRGFLVFFLTGTAIVLWKLIMLMCYSEIPIVVVLSGSMEPGYYRGDLLILTQPRKPVEVGDIVVFKVKGREVPIVHRVHRMHITTNGTKRILTKGDNNYQHDEGLYNPGQFFIDEEDIMGRSVVYIPHVGSLTITMSETPFLRHAVIVVLLVIVFLFHDLD